MEAVYRSGGPEVTYPGYFRPIQLENGIENPIILEDERVEHKAEHRAEHRAEHEAAHETAREAKREPEWEESEGTEPKSSKEREPRTCG